MVEVNIQDTFGMVFLLLGLGPWRCMADLFPFLFLGAGFIGGMIAAIMYGITTLQTYLYYVYFPRDSHSLKFLVALIWVLDTLHVSFMCHALYHYLVSSFGDADALTTAIWSLVVRIARPERKSPLLGFYLKLMIKAAVYGRHRANILYFSDSPLDSFEHKMVADMRHCKSKLSDSYGDSALNGDFVTSRWWLFSHTLDLDWRQSCSCQYSSPQSGSNVMNYLRFEKKEFSALQQITLYAATPFAIAAVLSDVCITIALCVLLHGNRSPVIETNVLVNTLIVYAINRCLLTSVVAVAEVIAFAISPASLWFIAIDFVIGKLYANSFLASLNSRSALRGRSHTHSEGTSFRVNTINLSGLGSGTGTSSEGDSSAGAQNKPPNVLRGAHVKTNSVGDRSLHGMGNLDKGEV
ncbi:hypothetical protein AZE42_06925 [Rhizopogon vesiculosus]|uniref:DUF6534 domain-containing protein n=1 Tax=Rhizopogon vesiculosus TaxID=180088 RepID=A0A1J8PPI1_9AGAM|nr:hypothetical protein AZE42_06925 [Rhizopogon vesiculosus]